MKTDNFFISEKNRFILPDYSLDVFATPAIHGVLLDSVKQAVSIKNTSDKWLEEFLLHLSAQMVIPQEIISGSSQVIYIDNKPGLEFKNFLKICEVIASAKLKGYLFLSEIKLGRLAEQVILENNRIDIKAAIQYASGYHLFKQNLKNALLQQIIEQYNKPYFNWIKSFPDVFFSEILDFYDWDWEDLNNKGPEIGNLVIDLVFARTSLTQLQELTTTKPKMKYSKRNVPWLYLEHPNLQDHLRTVISLLKASLKSETIFYQLLNRTLPVKNELSIRKLVNQEPETDSEFEALKNILKPALKGQSATT